MKFEKYALKSGKVKWKFYHYLGLDPNTGKKDVLQRRGFDTKAEARDELLKLIKDYEHGQKIKQLNNDKYYFHEVVDLWLLFYEKQVKITTFMERKRLIYNHIYPFFKDYYINKISVKLCQKAVEHWYSSYSEASRLANLVNQIFKFGINRGFCIENPMAKTIRPKNTHKKEYTAPFYEKNELQFFLKTVKENKSFKSYTMLHLLSFTGLRRGELLGLKWKDINFSRKTLSVNRTLIYNEKDKVFQLSKPKTKNSIREIGIDDSTIQILLRWSNYQREFFLGRGINAGSPDQIVFTTQNNHFISDSYLRRIIKSITTEFDLPHITVHGFRHTHCSLLFEAGVNMQNVKERLGHSNIKTTMDIYAHVTKTERDKTADVFGNFMNEISI